MFLQQPFRCRSVFLIFPLPPHVSKCQGPCDMEQTSRKQVWIVSFVPGAKWQFFWVGLLGLMTLEHDVFVSEDSSWFRKNWNWWYFGKQNPWFLKMRFLHALWLLFFARISLVGKSQEKNAHQSATCTCTNIVLFSSVWSWQTGKPEQNVCSKKEQTTRWTFPLGV